MNEQNFPVQSLQQQPFFINPMSSLGSTVLELTNPEDNLRRLELAFRSMRENSAGQLERIPDTLSAGGFV